MEKENRQDAKIAKEATLVKVQDLLATLAPWRFNT
jgi:hypothetical protein